MAMQGVVREVVELTRYGNNLLEAALQRVTADVDHHLLRLLVLIHDLVELLSQLLDLLILLLQVACGLADDSLDLLLELPVLEIAFLVSVGHQLVH